MILAQGDDAAISQLHIVRPRTIDYGSFAPASVLRLTRRQRRQVAPITGEIGFDADEVIRRRCEIAHISAPPHGTPATASRASYCRFRMSGSSLPPRKARRRHEAHASRKIARADGLRAAGAGHDAPSPGRRLSLESRAKGRRCRAVGFEARAAAGR